MCSAVGTALLLYHSHDAVATLSYFTTLSNLIVVGFFTWILIRELMGKSNASVKIAFFKGGVTVGIVLTGLVYNLLLRPFLNNNDFGYDPRTIQDMFVHVVTPLMVAIDFIVFDAKGLIKKTTPLFWLIYPAGYWIYILIYNAFGGRFEGTGHVLSPYPYFFMNIPEYGPWGAMIVAAFVVGIGYGLYGIDRWGCRCARKKAKAGGRDV
ncbi:MAG: Pr6Pr family membrane protein [bacterium]